MTVTTPDMLNTYLTQWLLTATAGNVTHELDHALMRMRLYCKNCGSRLEVNKPESAEKLDYGMQEFVKLHRHANGHQSPAEKINELNKEIEKLNSEIKVKKLQIESEPGKSDIKPLIPSWNKEKGLENAEVVAKNQLHEKYQQMLEKTLYDKEWKVPQPVIKGKVVPIDSVQEEDAALAKKLAANKQKLDQYMQMMQQITTMLPGVANGMVTNGMPTTPPTPAPPPPKPKAAKTKTGRRFR